MGSNMKKFASTMKNKAWFPVSVQKFEDWDNNLACSDVSISLISMLFNFTFFTS